MYNRRVHSLSMSLLVAALLAATPAAAYKKINVLYPIWPSNPLDPAVKQLAIMDFAGPGGSEFADQLIQSLLRDDEYNMNGRILPKTRLFDIIERSRMSAIMKEQNLSESGRIDDASAAEYGKIAGVDAIMIGTIGHEPNSARTRREVQTKTGTYYENCLTNSVRSSFNARIIDVNTGKILAVFDYGEFSGESTGCGDKAPKPHSEQTTMNTIMLNSRVLTALCGSLTYAEREFEKIKTKEFADICTRAAEAAEAKDFLKAYILYKSVYDQDPYCAGCAYNLGVMHEVVGNYAQAVDLYQSANGIEPGNKDMARALATATNSLEGLKKTQALMGFDWPEYVFPTDEKAMTQAMLPKLTTAGKKSERVQVYDGPAGKATFKVPGELEVTVLEDSGAWIKIGLPDGKEVWLEEASVDKSSLKKARKTAGDE